ncbi:MAG: outer membrane protein assembly factor BamA [Pseudomonadota bacterium]
MKAISSNILCLILLLTFAGGASAFEVKDIRLEGLQRIAAGTVFTYLPVKVGDEVGDVRSAEIIHALYKTGFFKDVQLGREGDVLVLRFVERPSIAKITFSGNEEIKDEQLNTVLKDVGLVEGRIFNTSLLDRIVSELERQYYSQGKYGVEIKTALKDEPRNRVSVDIKIDEGDAARIYQVKLIGNKAYSEDDLLGRFESGEPGLIGLFSSRDKYSKPKLVGDLEILRSYYMDHGYIDFTIESTQVSVTPDKKGVYVTINLSEGEQFTVKDVKLAGDLKVAEAELRELLLIKPGAIFSRKDVTESSAKINERLSFEGYAFANVNAVPEIDREKKEVALTFFIDPGKRVYVRRVNIEGNTKTQDEVVRREIRQMEGGWVDTQRINRSKTRLQRLGYLQEVSVETPAVPGTSDQMDVNFKVSEGPSGSLQAGAGYGTNGAIFNISVTEQNFLGTGKHLKLDFDNSRATTVYTLSYTDPYYTLDGISRGMSLYSKSTDAGAANVAAYFTDVLGASLTYGFPLSEFNTARLGFSFETTDLGTTSSTPASILDWIDVYGSNFDTYKINATWSHDKRNRMLFADEGLLQNLSLEWAVPGSDIEYYKLEHRQQWLFPFISTSVVSLSSTLGYGAGYGGTNDLPFFEYYYLGGVNSVRGFENNSLGPREGARVLGGNKKILGGAEVIFPPPSEEYAQSFRWSYFIDAGNVFGADESVDLGEIRISHGLAAKWVTPVGVLTFSLGWPLRKEEGDELQRFQFTIGAPF